MLMKIGVIKMKYEVLIETKNLSHEEWLEYRNKGIGGSDAAAIAGLNPYKSPAGVYLEKIGLSNGPEDNEKMRVGRDLEEYVAQRFTEATGLKVRKRNAILVHKDHEFMFANVDRLIVGKNEGLECKTTSSYGMKNWEGDEIPQHYILQCMHYMAVTGADAWYIACLIGNEKFVYKRIERDEEIINYLIQIEKDFWEEYVLKKQMPAPDGSEDSDKILNFLYPNSNGQSIELIGYEEKIHKLKKLKEKLDELDKEKKELEQHIKIAMADKEVAFIGESKITWKSSERNTFDTKEFKVDYPELYDRYTKVSSSRRFLVK